MKSLLRLEIPIVFHRIFLRKGKLKLFLHFNEYIKVNWPSINSQDKISYFSVATGQNKPTPTFSVSMVVDFPVQYQGIFMSTNGDITFHLSLLVNLPNNAACNRG